MGVSNPAVLPELLEAWSVVLDQHKLPLRNVWVLILLNQWFVLTMLQVPGSWLITEVLTGLPIIVIDVANLQSKLFRKKQLCQSYRNKDPTDHTIIKLISYLIAIVINVSVSPKLLEAIG